MPYNVMRDGGYGRACGVETKVGFFCFLTVKNTVVRSKLESL